MKGNLAHCTFMLVSGTASRHLLSSTLSKESSSEVTKLCRGGSPASGKETRQEESSRPALHRVEPFCNSSPPWDLDPAGIIISILQMRKVKF